MTHALGRIAKVGLIVFAVLVAGLVLLMAVSYALYFSPKAADLPCRSCSGAARAVQVHGFDLYYRSVGQRGSNPPVVLLHGGPGMSSDTFKKGFDFLADRYEVIYYDQRGSGNSQIKPDTSNYTIEQLVEELETLRRDVLKSEQMIVVGHSAGGASAQRYALKYPERVNKLILVAALPANGGQAFSGVIMDAIFATLNVLGGNIPAADPVEADTRFAELSYKSALPRLYDTSHPETIQDFGYYSFASNREFTQSTWGGNYDEQLQQLNMPALIIYGAGDGSGYTGEARAQEMQQAIPGAVLARFDHSGHWPYLEEPQRFQETMNRFLQ